MSVRPASYDTVCKFLHWMVAALLITGLVAGDFASQTQVDALGYGVHTTIGIAVFVLTVVRIAWRIMNPSPEYPAFMPAWQAWIARTCKFSYFAVLFTVPLSAVVAYNEASYMLWLPLLGLHVGAALFHQYVRRDNVQSRMMPDHG